MFNWLFSRKPAAAPKETPKVRPSFFSTHAAESGGTLIEPGDVVRSLVKGLPKISVDGAQDDAAGGTTAKPILQQSNISDTLAMWFASQSFIGHQFCAILSQQWLINKACTMPARRYWRGCARTWCSTPPRRARWASATDTGFP